MLNTIYLLRNRISNFIKQKQEPEKALQETGSKRMLLDLLENLKYEYIPILTSFSQEAAKYKYRPSALKQLQDECKVSLLTI